MSLQSIAVDFQRDLNLHGRVHRFPGVYAPLADASTKSLADYLKHLPSEDRIHDLLKQHGGALLFRDFPVASAQDFSDFAHALELGPQPHAEVGRPPRRTVLAKGVNTANEDPPTDPIWVHNEYGWSKVYPGFVLFFALQTPDTGESPLIATASHADV